MAFRFQATNVFLTYSQCPISKEQLLLYIRSIIQIKEYCIAEEQHQDGRPHLHVFLQLTTRLNTTRPRYFDVTHEGIVYHPNTQAVKSIKNVSEYITKDDNYIFSDKFKNLQQPQTWSDMVQAENGPQFMQLMKQHYPKEYILQHQHLEYYAQKHFNHDIKLYEPVTPPTPFVTTAAMDNWIATEMPKV